MLLAHFTPSGSWNTKSKILNTRRETTNIASLVREYAGTELATLLVSSSHKLLPAILDTEGKRTLHARSTATNAQGQLSDYWDVPYEVEIVVQTNIIVRSAGPNRQLGDKDDIIFDSLKNHFVKP